MKKRSIAMLLSIALAVNMCSLTAAATEISGLTVISESSDEGSEGMVENVGQGGT